VAWPEAYLCAKWHLDPSIRLATTDLGRKLGRLCPCFGGAGSPSSTMWPGSRPTSLPSGILMHPADGHNRHGPKIGEGSAPYWGREAGSPSNTMLLGSRPTSLPRSTLIHPAIWPQQIWVGGCAPLGEGELGPTQCG